MLDIFIILKKYFKDTKNIDRMSPYPKKPSNTRYKYQIRSYMLYNVHAPWLDNKLYYYLHIYDEISVKYILCTNYFGLVNTPTFSRISWIFTWNTSTDRLYNIILSFIGGATMPVFDDAIFDNFVQIYYYIYVQIFILFLLCTYIFCSLCKGSQFIYSS